MTMVPDEPTTAPLKAFQEMVPAGPPAPAVLDALLLALEHASTLEHALAHLRQVRDPRWEPFRARLKAAVARSRVRRMGLWQTDPRRRTLCLCFEVAGPSCLLHPPALVAQLAGALTGAGLSLAMGLEKVPRPAVHLGHPLPLEVPGRGEWADAVLTEDGGPLLELPGRINAVAPEGLRVLHCAIVPNYASPVADLCARATWRWTCPPERLESAAARVAAFLATDHFEMEKPGKTGGQKGVKRLEIRSMVEAMTWRGSGLEFRTRITSGQALNPRKLLGAILALEPAAIVPLERLQLHLAEDPRLEQADRFEPKLHNMFEDAVLLDSGSHIRIFDDDDDAPIVLADD